MEHFSINSLTDNCIDFDITAQGVDVKKGKVHLCVHITDSTTYQFSCTHKVGVNWEVNIPKKTLKNGSYDFSITIIINELFFEPHTGKIDVISGESITITKTDEVVSPKVDDKIPKQVKTPAPKSPKVEKIVTNKIVESVESVKYSLFKTDHPYETMPDHGHKDKKVKEILKTMAKNTKKI